MDIGNYFNSRLFLNEYCASNEIFTGNEFDSKTVERSTTEVPLLLK